MLEVTKVTLDINSSVLNDFYKTCEYLHKVHRLNCFYNKSVAFQYVIKQFNKQFENQSVLNINNNILKYNIESIKKDKQVGFCIDERDYNLFIRNCNRINAKKRPLLRSLINRTVKLHNKIE